MADEQKPSVFMLQIRRHGMFNTVHVMRDGQEDGVVATVTADVLELPGMREAWAEMLKVMGAAIVTAEGNQVHSTVVFDKPPDKPN